MGSCACLIIQCSVHLFCQTLTASLRHEGVRTRTNLKVLETLTYSCTCLAQLEILANKLDNIITEFRSCLPKADGLLLRPQARLLSKKRAKQIQYKYLTLPPRIKRGRAKDDWRYRNRVGHKAETLRKV